jgi:hypothetical protein
LFHDWSPLQAPVRAAWHAGNKSVFLIHQFHIYDAISLPSANEDIERTGNGNGDDTKDYKSVHEISSQSPAIQVLSWDSILDCGVSLFTAETDLLLAPNVGRGDLAAGVK